MKFRNHLTSRHSKEGCDNNQEGSQVGMGGRTWGLFKAYQQFQYSVSDCFSKKW